MAIPPSSEDTLLSILNEQRRAFEAQHSHLSQQAVNQLWQDKIVNAYLLQQNQAYSNVSKLGSPKSSSAMQTPTTASTRRRSLNTPFTKPTTPGGITMSRKRSTHDRMVADAISPNRITQFQIDNEAPFDAYVLGSAPKMQKLPSGRKAIPRIQTASTHYDDHATNGASMTPFDTSFPSVFDNALHTRSASMGRQESLSGSFYSRVAGMQIASPIESRMIQAQYSPFLDTVDFDTETFPLFDDMGASSAPIPIPEHHNGPSGSRHHSGQRSRNGVPRPNHRDSSANVRPSSIINFSGNQTPPNRLLAPRPNSDSEPSSVSSSPQSDTQIAKPVKFLDANGKASEKYQISKVNRPRRQEGRRFYCVSCNKHPSGFRGQHELQRHYDAQHAPIKKAWICVDPTPGGEKLKNCRWCREQKIYPAYYNAAAHLRRIHFKSESDNGKGKKPRGGFSGGKYPSMEILKSQWLKQVELKNGQIIEDDGETDLDIVDDEEISIEGSGLSDFERVDMMPPPHEYTENHDSLAGQAAWKAELAAPNLSTTVETAASSFNGSVGTGVGMNCFDIESMSASGLLAATSANATIGGDDLQRSLCSIDTSNALDVGLSIPLADFEFADVFPDLDTTLPLMPYEGEH